MGKAKTPAGRPSRKATAWTDVTQATRNVMTANRCRDTGPELTVRRMLHARGYRFRLCRKDLPGRPDLAFPGRRAVIEVRGCFWHGHDCGGDRAPKTRTEYWIRKIGDNRRQDERNARALADLGWHLHDVWECDLRRNPEQAVARAAAFLDGCAAR